MKNMMSTIDAERLIEKNSAMQLSDAHHVEQIIADNHSLQQGKDDLKNAFLESERKQLILEYLGRDPTTWPTAQEKETTFKASRQDKAVVKKKYEALKSRVAEVVEKIGIEYRTLQEKTKNLEAKLKIFEEKKAVFISKRTVDPTQAKAAIEKCQGNVDTLKSELTNQKELMERLKVSMDSLKKHKMNHRVASVDGGVIQRSQTILEFLESMTGVKIVETTPNTITVEFSEDFANSLETDCSKTNLSLTLTLTFGKRKTGKSKLTDVQIMFKTSIFVNIDHFNIKDIIDVAIETNDVPYLIRTVQKRWLQHYPMLSEIEVLNKHHAIDWIQKESRLRVLVGNCGKVMFTLAVPENYPHSRNIILVDSYGIENVDIEKLPGPEASLLDWVRHLEDMYGEKSG